MTESIVNHFAVSLNATQWTSLREALLDITTLLHVLIRANTSRHCSWGNDTILEHYLYLLETHVRHAQQIVDIVQQEAVMREREAVEG